MYVCMYVGMYVYMYIKYSPGCRIATLMPFGLRSSERLLPIAFKAAYVGR